MAASCIAPAIIDKCRLIKLKRKSKVPAQSTWSIEESYDPDDIDIINHIDGGNNYGIIPTNGLIVIDCDTDKLYQLLPEAWKKSLTIITGRDDGSGKHIFLSCHNSIPDKFVLNDPDTLKSLGDIRGSESPFYTVGAGSIHPDTKKQYAYVDASALLVEVDWQSDIVPLLEKLKAPLTKSIPKHAPSTTGSLADKLNLHIENFAYPINPKTMSNGDIQGEHPVHGSSTKMNFAINTSKNVWHCYRHNVGGDVISWIAYAHCEVDESRCNALSPEEFMGVKDWLHDNGYSKEIDALDDEHFGISDDSDVDLSGILNPKTDIEKEIIAAQARHLLPKFPSIDGGVFKDYVDFGKKVSYSLEEYHFAALLSIASMAIGRKAVTKIGMTSVYPNVFVMVVGQTTISGKSVACNIAVDNLGKSIVYEEPIAKCYSTNILRGTISESALVQSLNDTYNSLWYYDDCAGFFEDIPSWNAHILGTMCSIYDGCAIERTLSKRAKKEEQFKWSCPSPYVSILFNTTTKDIEQVASSRLFSSGFFPRLMWFYGQGGQPRKNNDITDDEKKTLSDIKAYVAEIRSTLAKLPEGAISFKVCHEIEDWKINSTINRLGKEDEAYRTAISRGFIHAYKIATILTIFDRNFPKEPGVYDIPANHAAMAIRIVDQYLIPRMMFIYDMCNSVDNKNLQVIVLKSLNHFGGSAERSKVLRQTHLNRRELDMALATLIESGEVAVHKITKEGNDKPTCVIIKL